MRERDCVVFDDKKEREGIMRNKMLKRIAAVVITGSMLLSSMTVFAAEFPDVPAGSWYYDPVQFVSDVGIMTGYADGRFGPSDNVTRGQFVTTLYRVEDQPETAFEWGIYSDVEDGKFYSIPSIWSYRSGAMTGYVDGRFGVHDSITREQVATVLYRYASNLGLNMATGGNIWNFPDGGKVSSFARDGMGWAVGAGIITGSQGNLDPQGKASRAQIATIFQRFFEWVVFQIPEEHEHEWVEEMVSVEVPTIWETHTMSRCNICNFETPSAREINTHCNETGHNDIYTYDAHNVEYGTHWEDQTKTVCSICGEEQ